MPKPCEFCTDGFVDPGRRFDCGHCFGEPLEEVTMSDTETTAAPDLARLEELHEKATPEPWSLCSIEGQAQLHDLFPDRYPKGGVTIQKVSTSREEAMETFFYTVLSGWISRADAELFVE